MEAIRARVNTAERDIGEGGVELRVRESKACLDLLVVDRLLPFSPTIGSRWQSREAGLEAIVLQGRLCRVEVDVPRRRYSSKASDLYSVAAEFCRSNRRESRRPSTIEICTSDMAGKWLLLRTGHCSIAHDSRNRYL